MPQIVFDHWSKTVFKPWLLLGPKPKRFTHPDGQCRDPSNAALRITGGTAQLRAALPVRPFFEPFPMPRLLLIVVVLLAAFAPLAENRLQAEQPVTDFVATSSPVRDAIAGSLPYLEKQGLWWRRLLPPFDGLMQKL